MTLEPYTNVLTLILAAGIDYLIGDPVDWLHPVQVMGSMIALFTNIVLTPNRIPKFAPPIMKALGVVLGLSLIVGSGLASWLIVAIPTDAVPATMKIHPLLELIISSLLLGACFAGRSLRAAAEDVIAVLTSGDLVAARKQLSRYVGRDTDNLSEAEILRAVLETITENAIDAVTAPLFYAVLGSALIPYGGVSFAIAYKAASTLDSMVGYRESPYTDLGWFSAKIEDILTWLPCRLTVLTLALLSGKPLDVLRICQRDARLDPSPNSGWSECVYAAILQVQVGGANSYRGQIKHKPLLGEAIAPITPTKIHQALALTRTCFLLWLSIAVIGFAAVFIVYGS